jgi:hypothetical protein
MPRPDEEKKKTDSGNPKQDVRDVVGKVVAVVWSRNMGVYAKA